MGLLSWPETRLSCKDAGHGVARAFLDAEEVRGSNPLAPTEESSARGVAGPSDAPWR
jgi:hypothetical protein